MGSSNNKKSNNIQLLKLNKAVPFLLDLEYLDQPKTSSEYFFESDIRTVPRLFLSAGPKADLYSRPTLCIPYECVHQLTWMLPAISARPMDNPLPTIVKLHLEPRWFRPVRPDLTIILHKWFILPEWRRPIVANHSHQPTATSFADFSHH